MALVFITGANDGEDQTSEAQRGDVAGAVFAPVEQRSVGAGVLPARGDQREFILAPAVLVEGFWQSHSSPGQS